MELVEFPSGFYEQAAYAQELLMEARNEYDLVPLVVAGAIFLQIAYSVVLDNDIVLGVHECCIWEILL